MTITFTFRSNLPVQAKPAIITARQLAAFRSFARDHGQLVGGFLAYGFEARVCPLSWATIARLFDDSEAVIAVVEEAQFLGLNVRFWKDNAAAAIMMGVATTPDGSRSLILNDAAADALLETLGQRGNVLGDIDVPELARCIANPATRRHLGHNGLSDILDHLDAVVKQPPFADTRLVWD